MKRIFGFLLMVVMALAASAAWCGEVPGITLAEFASDTSAEANALWLILAGQGAWGAILFGVLGLVWKVARPYVVEWMSRKKLEKLYLAIEACVAQTQAVYVEGMKAAHADGKLTELEKAEVFAKCKQNVIAFMATQGVDVIREYGDVVIDCLIEFILSRLKMNNAVARAVIPPLPDLAH